MTKYSEVGIQPYSRLGITAVHNFRQDDNITTIRFVKGEKSADNHNAWLYNCLYSRDEEKHLEGFTAVDATTISGIGQHLKEDATKPLPSEILLVRARANERLIVILFKEDKKAA